MNEALSTKDAKKLNKASALSYSSNPKDQDRARARQVDVDYKDLLRQINSRKKPNKPAVSKMKEHQELLDENSKTVGTVVKQLARIGAKKVVRVAKDKKVRKAVVKTAKKIGSAGLEGAVSGAEERAREAGHDSTRNIGKKKETQESFTIDKPAHSRVQKQKKMRNLAIKNPNKNEGDVAHKKAGGPKLIGEGRSFADWKKAAASALKKKKEEKKPQKAMDAGARAKRLLQRKEYASKVSGSTENVPDEMRD